MPAKMLDDGSVTTRLSAIAVGPRIELDTGQPGQLLGRRPGDNERALIERQEHAFVHDGAL